MAFSRGFAVGFGARSQLRNEKLQEEQEFVAKNDAVAQNLIKNAAEIAKQAAIVGKPVDLEEFRIRYQGLIESASVARARRFNTDPDTILAQQDARLAQFESAIAAAASVPSVTEAAQVKGRASAAGAVATAEALTEAGRPTGVTEAARGAGILPEDSITVREIADEEGNKDLIVLDKAGNTIRTIEGGPDVELTGVFSSGTKKDAEGRVLATTQLLRNTAKLSSLLSDETVGLVPAFRGFLNTTLAQAAPGAFDEDRAAFERFTKLTRQSALRVVSDESRFSEADRDFIFDLFPETGAFESEPNAAIKLLAMQAFFLDRLGPDLTAAGLSPAEFDTGLKPETVKDATLSGFLNEDQAVRMLEMVWPQLFGPE